MNLLATTDISTSEVREYTWDYRNRLTNVTVKDSSENVIQESDYTYDPLDRRIGVEVDPDGDGAQGSTERWTAYDGMNPYADFDGSGNLTHRYLYGPRTDQILARMDSSQDVAWYLTDHLGTVRDLADPEGNVIDHITYDSFGNVLSESAPAEGDRFKYTGRELDAETGLYYYRARYYDPATGRFISQDPIGFEAGDANIYRYVHNAPTTRTDPSGLEEQPGPVGEPVVDPNPLETFYAYYKTTETKVEAEEWANGTTGVYEVTYEHVFRYSVSVHRVTHKYRRYSDEYLKLQYEYYDAVQWQNAWRSGAHAYSDLAAFFAALTAASAGDKRLAAYFGALSAAAWAASNKAHRIADAWATKAGDLNNQLIQMRIDGTQWETYEIEGTIQEYGPCELVSSTETSRRLIGAGDSGGNYTPLPEVYTSGDSGGYLP